MITILKIDKNSEISSVKDAIKKCPFKITKLLIDNTKIEPYIIYLKINYSIQTPDWKNLNRSGAEVVEGKFGKYDKNAAKHNDDIMLGQAEALIYIGQKPFLAKSIDENKIFEYNSQKNENNYDYTF